MNNKILGLPLVGTSLKTLNYGNSDIASPSTISSTGISFRLLSRSTIAFICTIAGNFSTAYIG